MINAHVVARVGYDIEIEPTNPNVDTYTLLRLLEQGTYRYDPHTGDITNFYGGLEARSKRSQDAGETVYANWSSRR